MLTLLPITVRDRTGVGYGQILSTCFVATYYASLMATTIRYFLSSFAADLPWAVCDPAWGTNCYDSQTATTIVNGTTAEHGNVSSSILYYQ